MGQGANLSAAEIAAPACIECGTTAELVTGKAIYPHRPDLHNNPIWQCPACGAYVGCHPGTNDPLGYPAGPETRTGRSYVHRVLDPIWKTAPQSYGPDAPPHAVLRRIARSRVYAYLADQMALTRDECHTGMFNIHQCRQAYAILKRTSYADVRRWAKQRNNG